MRRIVTLATFIALAQIIMLGGLPTPQAQSPGFKETKARLIKVTAATVFQTPENKKYVVDLTRSDAVYVLDSRTRPIDFARVVIRTPDGEDPIDSWLNKNFSRSKLAGWDTKHFSLGNPQAVKLVRGLTIKTPPAPTGSSAFQCLPGICYCSGNADCNVMFTSNVCSLAAACDEETDYCACLTNH